jgi:hypothetical protein
MVGTGLHIPKHEEMNPGSSRISVKEAFDRKIGDKNKGIWHLTSQRVSVSLP